MAFTSAVAIFLGSFLLFLVQPVIGKMILPWFGGTPAVWTTCMLFFQVLLLAGYAYAALLARIASPVRQATIHIALLSVSLLLLPITPSAVLEATRWRIPCDSNPADARRHSGLALLFVICYIATGSSLVRASLSELDRPTGCTRFRMSAHSERC